MYAELNILTLVFPFQHFIPKDGVKWNYLCILSSLRTVVSNNRTVLNLIKIRGFLFAPGKTWLSLTFSLQLLKVDV